MLIQCERCNITFSRRPSQVRLSRHHFCSRKCLAWTPEEKRLRRKEANKRWRESHPSTVRAAHRRWRIKYPDKVRARHRRYYKLHRTDCLRACKRRYETHRDQIKAYHQQYNRVHRARLRAYQARWRKTNYETWAPQHRAAIRNRRARLKGVGGTHTSSDIARLFKRQDGRCVYCNARLERYEVDHIIPVSRGGSNWPSNLQLLCMRCNRSKQNKLPEEFSRSQGLLL
jgi:5-methylcytosine-specific restriction endonuclease McrA